MRIARLDRVYRRCHDNVMAVMRERSKVFQARMSLEELRMLNAIAGADGLTASDVVRQLVRREFVARFGNRKQTRSKD
jgi:hypothetical protein